MSKTNISIKQDTDTNSNNKKILCIGGGTGTFVVLNGLKQYTKNLSVIVTMSDSGGSNKRIRDEFGLLPTSDIRQCLVALAEEKNGRMGLLRQLFMYRFDKGKGISGMTFGNLFMAALSDILGSQKEAIRQTGKVLRIHGSVIPVSFTDTNLFAVYENGHEVGEEHLIDEPKHDGKLKIKDLYLKPEAEANSDAINSINEADIIIFGPGDLYTSVLPNLIVNGIKETISKSKAKKIYIMNLMTKFGQTYNYSASDHLGILENYAGCKMDVVVLNNSKLDENALKLYAKTLEYPVKDDLNDDNRVIIRQKIVSDSIISKSSSDHLVRSLIRHDSDKLAKAIIDAF